MLTFDKDDLDLVLEDYIGNEKTESFIDLMRSQSTKYPIASLLYFASIIDIELIDDIIKYHLNIEVLLCKDDTRMRDIIDKLKLKNKMFRHNIKRFELCDTY